MIHSLASVCRSEPQFGLKNAALLSNINFKLKRRRFQSQAHTSISSGAVLAKIYTTGKVPGQNMIVGQCCFESDSTLLIPVIIKSWQDCSKQDTAAKVERPNHGMSHPMGWHILATPVLTGYGIRSQQSSCKFHNGKFCLRATGPTAC